MFSSTVELKRLLLVSSTCNQCTVHVPVQYCSSVHMINKIRRWPLLSDTSKVCVSLCVYVRECWVHQFYVTFLLHTCVQIDSRSPQRTSAQLISLLQFLRNVDFFELSEERGSYAMLCYAVRKRVFSRTKLDVSEAAGLYSTLLLLLLVGAEQCWRAHSLCSMSAPAAAPAPSEKSPRVDSDAIACRTPTATATVTATATAAASNANRGVRLYRYRWALLALFAIYSFSNVRTRSRLVHVLWSRS